jgi:hypothetical protein
MTSDPKQIVANRVVRRVIELELEGPYWGPMLANLPGHISADRYHSELVARLLLTVTNNQASQQGD